MVTNDTNFADFSFVAPFPPILVIPYEKRQVTISPKTFQAVLLPAQPYFPDDLAPISMFVSRQIFFNSWLKVLVYVPLPLTPLDRFIFFGISFSHMLSSFQPTFTVSNLNDVPYSMSNLNPRSFSSLAPSTRG